MPANTTTEPLGDRSERGAALPAVLLATVILMGLATLFVATAVNQTRATGSQRDYQSALPAAEGEAEFAVHRIGEVFAEHAGSGSGGRAELEADLAVLSADVGGHCWPEDLEGRAEDPEGRAERRAELLDHWWPHVPEAEKVELDGGQAAAVWPVVCRESGEPEQADFVFGVAERNGSTRVVMLTFEMPDWQPGDDPSEPDEPDEPGEGGYVPPVALLTGSHLSISGNAQIRGSGAHTNGNAGARGSFEADGSLTGSGDYDYSHDYHLDRDPPGPHPVKCNVERLVGEVPEDITPQTCHPDDPYAHSGGGRDEIPIPHIDARDFYASSQDVAVGPYDEGDWFDLCPDGTIRAPDPEGVQPCSGEVLGDGDLSWPHYEGWEYKASQGRWRSGLSRGPFGPEPHWENEERDRSSAVWYAYHTDVILQGSNGQTPITVIAEADPDDKGGSGSITTRGSGRGYQPFFADTLFVADRDVDMGASFSTDGAGIVLAGEAVSMSGNFFLQGSVIARNDPHTKQSPVKPQGTPVAGEPPENRMAGSTHIEYDETQSIGIDPPDAPDDGGDDDGGDDGSLEGVDVDIESWQEL